MHELIAASAVELRKRLASQEVTPLDLLDALETRIADVNPRVHALPTLCFDRARDAARLLMARGAASRGALRGLPVAMKDLVDVAGVRSTKGSPIFADHVPTASSPVTLQVEAEGGVVYAKSNTPEFGAGASTFNQLFETTRNPHDLSKSAAGSSGGSAAALASGMAWLAHGSDLGGSLRNPASFCGVVGMRPSIGRAPGGTISDRFDTLFIEGPMARSVADLALFFDGLTGWERASSAELTAAGGAPHLAAAQAPKPPKRVAYSKDLGVTPVDPQVAEITRAAADRLARQGIVVEEAHPDFSGAHEAFQTLRAVAFAASMSELYETKRDQLKPDVIWNIEKAADLSGQDVARAIATRARIAHDVARFFQTYDLLLSPATIVTPFSADTRTVEECAGTTFETYIDWLAIVFAVTLSGCPAMSIPCGFSREGLPIGLQVVGPERGEMTLLAQAAAIESILGTDPRPIDPKTPAGSTSA